MHFVSVSLTLLGIILNKINTMKGNKYLDMCKCFSAYKSMFIFNKVCIHKDTPENMIGNEFGK